MEILRSTKSAFYPSLARLAVRRRGWILAAYLVVTAFLAWRGARIPLRADLTDLLPAGAPSAEDLRFFSERFGGGEPISVVLTAADPSDLESLQDAADAMTAELEETGLFQSVRGGSATEAALATAEWAVRHLPVLLPPERLPELERRLHPAGVRTRLRMVREGASDLLAAGSVERLAAADPLALADLALPSAAAWGSAAPAGAQIDPLSGLILSADGRSTLILATPRRPPQDLDFSRRLLQTLDALAAGAQAESPGLSVAHAGGYLFALQDEARIRHDITVTACLSALAIASLFAFALRRLRLLFVLIVPLACSTVWTLGLASFHPGHLNVVTVGFAAILLGVGDDSLTHLYVRFHEELRAGIGRSEALQAAMAACGPSVLPATLTSGTAFAALSFVAFRGLAELGIIAALGMANLLVTALVLFPALLSFPALGGGAGTRAPTLPIGAFVRLHEWASRRRAAILGAALLGVAAAGGTATARLEFSSDLRALRGRDPARQRLEQVVAPFGGMRDPVYLVRQGGSVDEALAGIEPLLKVARLLQEEGLVLGYSPEIALVPALGTQRERFEAAAGLPWEEAERSLRQAAADLGMQVGFFAPFFEALADYRRWEEVRIDPAEAPFPLRIASGPADAAAALALFPAPGSRLEEIEARARALAPAAMATPTRMASVERVTGDLARVIARDFRRASVIALSTVAAVSLLAFRSARRLALAAMPVVCGSALMLGALAISGVPINLMSLVAAPLVFGLGIDFGIYIVNQHAQDGDAAAALRHTGGAILLTGMTTLTGFGSLLAADFAGLRSMGWVAVLGIGGCLLSALVLLPLALAGTPPAARASPGR
jgi:hypothetical protein